ncbi:MAG TPA: GAF domain-containing sensor histidine kinase [Acidimicrobiales bacterium]|nr:GAF domain-containing sensor histidine kinase [Acidimicrobiales bacterium]
MTGSPPMRGLTPAEASGGHDEHGGGENFTAVVTAIRWTTAAVAILVLSTNELTRADGIAGAVVLSLAVWRTVAPVDMGHGLRPAFLPIVFEAAVTVGVVLATGKWSSPYALLLFTVVSMAGFSGGIQAGLVVAGGCLIAIAVPYHVGESAANAATTVQWGGELALVAVVTGYARRITVRAKAQTTAYLDRLQQLSEANGLLLQLHRVASSLPMSLDVDETLESAVHRLSEMFEPDVLVVLVRDERSGWTVVRAAGTSLPDHVADGDLPPVLASTAGLAAPRLEVNLPAETRLGAATTSAVYAPLRARDELVGLVAVERGGAPFEEKEQTLMEGFAEQLAVALDNARWFARIGTLAAERERTRIARELHDRVGQSLALVGFELDRAAKSPDEREIRRQVEELRHTVRAVTGELRETLYDLRTDVSEEQGMAQPLTDFVDRVGRRANLRTMVAVEESRRLPLTVEREVWRIAQEAITNVERHARASTMRVAWVVDGDRAVLTVADDGRGMPPEGERRPDSYGLVGMQERADAIGATLTVTSAPGAGTEIRVSVAA